MITRDQQFIVLALLTAMLIVAAVYLAGTVVPACQAASEKLKTCNCSDFCARPYYYQSNPREHSKAI